MKVFGPYTRKDKRQHVVIQDSPGGKLKTVSYPKYLMEQQLGRELDPDKETIDHIDGDFTNNNFSNLRVIPRSQHISEDRSRAKMVELPCVECNTKTVRSPSYVRGRAKRGIAGPFCSRQCSGKYGSRRQQGCEKLPAQEYVTTEFYKVPKTI